jgi:carbon storage regulator
MNGKEGPGMLVLTRGVGERIVIADDIIVTVAAVKGDQVRLGITAPKHVRVDRMEVHEQRSGLARPAERIADVSAEAGG